jgi:hypothetical protein
MKDLEADGPASKYWEIELDHSPPGSKSKVNSYLRLGTAEANPLNSVPEGETKVPPQTKADMSHSANARRGHDLAAMVQDFIDDGRQRGPHAPDQATRDAQTAALHTKGGWRDHSDGNRISTTRGDKVEVVRGNYKLLVLGRQDELDGTAEWDASGGLLQDGDIAPGAVTEIKWEQNPFNGTWTVTEECGKGNIINRFHGNVEEHYFGETITTRVGSEGSGNISGWTDSDALTQPQTNPVIDERTWAQSITEHTTVSGKLFEKTTALGGAEDHLTVKGPFTETVSIDGAHIAAGVAHFYLEATAFSSAKIELEAQPVHLQLEVAPFSLDVFVGAGIEIAIGAQLEIVLAATDEITPFEKKVVYAKATDLTALKTELSTDKQILTNRVTSLENSRTDLRSKVTKLENDVTSVSGKVTTLSTRVDNL